MRAAGGESGPLGPSCRLVGEQVGRGRNRGHCGAKGGKADRDFHWPNPFPPRWILAIKVSGSLPPRGPPPWPLTLYDHWLARVGRTRITGSVVAERR